MIQLFHGPTSVCSIKARIALTEKQLPWQSVLMDLTRGDQFEPDYLALNPEAVVPTLVHDRKVVRESSALIAYADRLSPDFPLTPLDQQAWADTQMWLVRCIEIHAGINTMTFATYFREKELKAGDVPQTAARVSRLVNPQNVAKRRDLFEKGANSTFVDGALFTFFNMLKDMQTSLGEREWLVGPEFSLADIALIGYVDRLERLSMAGLWTNRFPDVGRWLEQMRQRPSYTSEVLNYIGPETAAETRAFGALSWDIIEDKWRKHGA